MNRRVKRSLQKANLKMIKDKQQRVGKVQATAFIALKKIIDELYPEVGVPDEEIKLLIDKTHENKELQATFDKYKEAKHAGVYLSMMRKQVIEGTTEQTEEPKTKQEVMNVNITE